VAICIPSSTPPPPREGAGFYVEDMPRCLTNTALCVIGDTGQEVVRRYTCK